MCGPLPGFRLLSVFSGSHPDPLPRFVLSTHGWGDFFRFSFSSSSFTKEKKSSSSLSGAWLWSAAAVVMLTPSCHASPPRRCMILPGAPARCSRAWVGAPRCLGLRCPRCSAFSRSLSQTFPPFPPPPLDDFQADSRAVKALIGPLSSGSLLCFLNFPPFPPSTLCYSPGERRSGSTGNHERTRGRGRGELGHPGAHRLRGTSEEEAGETKEAAESKCDFISALRTSRRHICV